MVEYEKMEEEHTQTLRKTAFAGVCLSTVAVTAFLIAFPMVFHHVQMLQADIQGEIDNCKVCGAFTTIV